MVIMRYGSSYIPYVLLIAMVCICYGSHVHDDQHQHQHHSHDINVGMTLDGRPLVTVWIEAIIATLAISIFPFLILPLVPLGRRNAQGEIEIHTKLMNVLLAFAVGGLLGDSLLHLIPHALHPHHHHNDHHHHHSEHDDDVHDHSIDIGVGMWVIIGMLGFFIVEKIIRASSKGDHHSHGHSHTLSPPATSAVKKKNDDAPSKDTVHGGIKVAGYLNLVADFSHNFTDGLGIGASFLAGRAQGISTTFAILVHEIPHEIGDFAILIQSGFSRKQAMFAQLATAMGALTGTVIGLGIGSVSETVTSSIILPFTAGGFIYIATVTVMPELLKEVSGVVQTLLELGAIGVGLGLMVIIALYE